MDRRTRKRRVGVGPVLACLLWIAGFEVLPTVHMAFHHALGVHHHGVQHDSLGHRPHEHEHDEGHHHHQHGEAYAHHGDTHHEHALHHDDHGLLHEHGDDADHDDDGESPAHHGENSLAHRHLAAEHSLPAIPAVPQALVLFDRVFERAIDSVRLDGQLMVRRARGPPMPAGAFSIL